MNFLDCGIERPLIFQFPIKIETIKKNTNTNPYFLCTCFIFRMSLFHLMFVPNKKREDKHLLTSIPNHIKSSSLSATVSTLKLDENQYTISILLDTSSYISLIQGKVYKTAVRIAGGSGQDIISIRKPTNLFLQLMRVHRTR